MSIEILKPVFATSGIRTSQCVEQKNSFLLKSLPSSQMLSNETLMEKNEAHKIEENTTWTSRQQNVKVQILRKFTHHVLVATNQK